ncbi:MAG: hypothetical protein ABSA51_08210 [Anaerolineaceae bacterium]|jgi:hypothetical protein
MQQHTLGDFKFIDNAYRSIISLAGIAFVLIGLSIFLDPFLHTAWLTLIILAMAGIVALIQGIKLKKLGLLLTGGIALCVGVSGYVAFNILTASPLVQRIGVGVLAFGMGWGLITFFTRLFTANTSWWALVPASVFASTGACLIFSSLKVVDFVLYISICLGLAFLVWSVSQRLFGLAIPGSLLIGVGLGVFLGWSNLEHINGLAQTGMTLVWFGISWGLIIIFGRVIMERFIWWPLIPGGVLAMVGWGLYIGGNPGSALSFIGNTGSLGLVIVGAYLLLLRRGIRK